MIEYKYQKVKGLSEKKFLENGHTMFEEDVLQRLKRLAYLEEQIKQGQLLPIDSVIAMLPTDADIEKYANGNFGYDRYSYEKEDAFKSGAEYIKDELTYKIKKN